MNPLHYWQYFIALESDLAHTTRFVEVVEANMETYSIEFARILLSAGAEVDVLFKILASQHGLAADPLNVVGYTQALHAKFPKLHALPILLPRYAAELFPWESLGRGCTPIWWNAHTAIKHRRHLNYQKATLRNALDAVAGLFVLVCYLCHNELRACRINPWPQLLSLDSRLSMRASGDLRPGHVLPDFA